MKYYCILLHTLFLVLLVRESYQQGRSSNLRAKNQFFRNRMHEEKYHLKRHKPRIFSAGFVKNIEETPFLAQLVREEPRGGRYKCAASIVTEGYLLTAAHCIMNCDLPPFNQTYPTNVYTVYAGGLSTYKSPYKGKVYDFFVHEEFSCEPYMNDIALVNVKDWFSFNRKINAVEIPPLYPQSDPRRPTYKNCVTYCWGTDSLHSDADYEIRPLKIAKTEIMDSKQFGLEINKSSQIVTSYPLYNSYRCSGDGGGPLVCDGMQVGVTSCSRTWCDMTGYDCITRTGGISTRIEYYTEWIESVFYPF